MLLCCWEDAAGRALNEANVEMENKTSRLTQDAAGIGAWSRDQRMMEQLTGLVERSIRIPGRQNVGLGNKDAKSMDGIRERVEPDDRDTLQ